MSELTRHPSYQLTLSMNDRITRINYRDSVFSQLVWQLMQEANGKFNANITASNWQKCSNRMGNIRCVCGDAIEASRNV